MTMNPQPVPPDKGGSYASRTKNGVSENVKVYGDIVAKQKRERKMISIKFSKMNRDDLDRNSKGVDM